MVLKKPCRVQGFLSWSSPSLSGRDSLSSPDGLPGGLAHDAKVTVTKIG
jgi:hypothetical protein